MKITNTNCNPYIKYNSTVEQNQVQQQPHGTTPPVRTSKSEIPEGFQPDSTVTIPPGSHLVLEKETLFSIANHYGTSVSEIIKLNPDLKTDKNGNKIIYTGTIIKVSDAEISSQIPQDDKPLQVYGSWQIKKGKGAYYIMSTFNLFREELQKLNPDIDLNKIREGEIFKVPGYKVKSGDTLESIATLYDITPETLQKLNPKFNGELKEGIILNVPKRAGQDLGFEDLEVEFDVITENPVEKITHTVKSGEALSLIAQKYHVPMWAIMLHNNIENEDKIFKNQVLEIPSQEEISKLEELKNKPPEKEETPKEYTVKSGDTLSEIALKYGVSVKQLLEWNNLKNDKIPVGKVLRVTQPEQTNEQKQETVVTYKVKSGDVLSVIASKYNVSTAALMYKNNIQNPKHLQIGQVLVIPSKDELSELEKAQQELKTEQRREVSQTQKISVGQPAETQQNTISQNLGIVIHKVRKNDTIRSISEKYGIPAIDIITYNENLKGIKINDDLSDKEIKNIRIIATKKAVIDATGVSQKFIDDLIAIEKKHSRLYTDACGNPTIGIGHNTRAHGDTSKYRGRTISDNEIYSLLARDIIEAQDSIISSIKKEAYDNLSGGQKEALYGLVFNTGGLSGSPKLIAALKNGDYTSAACEMDQAYGTINDKTQVLPGLAKRRFMDISKFIQASRLSARQIQTVMVKVQKIYNDGYDNIQRENNKVDYNAFAKKFLGPYIAKGWITIKD